VNAQRLEELRALIADLYWEVANQDWEGLDRHAASQLMINFNSAKWQLTDLRNSARQREDEAR
jgi:hypothetical protein